MNRIKNLFFCCIFVASIHVSAASQPEQGAIRISILSEYTHFFDPTNFSENYTIAGGLDIQWFVTDIVALDYQAVLGTKKGQGFYLNSGLGQIAGVYLLAQGYESYGSLAMFALLVPEGVSCHFPVGASMCLSPYIHPLEAQLNNGFDLAGEWGIKMSYYFKNGMSIQPHIGGRFVYFQKQIGLNVGLSVTLLQLGS